MKFTVIDNEFNRANYADLIGLTFNSPPSYAHIKAVAEDVVEKNICPICKKDFTEGFKVFSFRDGFYIHSEAHRNDILDEIVAFVANMAQSEYLRNRDLALWMTANNLIDRMSVINKELEDWRNVERREGK